jgi:hypothetical protein
MGGSFSSERSKYVKRLHAVTPQSNSGAVIATPPPPSNSDHSEAGRCEMKYNFRPNPIADSGLAGIAPSAVFRANNSMAIGTEKFQRHRAHRMARKNESQRRRYQS